MNRARRPLKSKREIYQLGAAKANGFIDMDTLSDARSKQVPVCLFFRSRRGFRCIFDGLNVRDRG